MKLLISQFIIDVLSWFFSNYSKMSFSYSSPAYTYSMVVTFNFIGKSIEGSNIVKFFMVSPCNLILDISAVGAAYFNPDRDCSSPTAYAFSSNMPSFVKYGAANSAQVTFVVQVRTPPDIT